MNWKKTISTLILLRILGWGFLITVPIRDAFAVQNPGWVYTWSYFLIAMIVIFLLLDATAIWALKKLNDKPIRIFVMYSSYASFIASVPPLIYFFICPVAVFKQNTTEFYILLGILLLSLIILVIVSVKKIELEETTKQLAEPVEAEVNEE